MCTIWVVEMVITTFVQSQDKLERNILTKKDTRKIKDTCISRMHVGFYEDGHVTATHVMGHTNHHPELHENMYLPLAKSIREEIAIRLSNGSG